MFLKGQSQQNVCMKVVYWSLAILIYQGCHLLSGEKNFNKENRICVFITTDFVCLVLFYKI